MNPLAQAAWVDALARTLVHFVWQGAVICLAYAVLARTLKRARSEVRYLAAIACLVVMAIAPVATLVYLSGPAPAPAPVRLVDASPVVLPALFEPADSSLPGPVRSPLLPLLVPLWLSGVLGVTCWSMAGWAVAMRWKRMGSVSVHPAWIERAREIARRVGVPGAFELRQSLPAKVPMVIGWLRPVILVPAGVLTAMPPRQIEAILAHELAHIRRHDYLVNLLQRAIEALLFYHPAVWWVSAKVREEREHCCDDIAVMACGDAVEYVRALASLEEMRHLPELAMAATGGSLLERVRRLLCPDAEHGPRAPLWLMLSLLLAGSIALWAVAGDRQDERFPEPPRAPRAPRAPRPARAPRPPRPVPAVAPDFDAPTPLPEVPPVPVAALPPEPAPAPTPLAAPAPPSPVFSGPTPAPAAVPAAPQAVRPPQPAPAPTPPDVPAPRSLGAPIAVAALPGSGQGFLAGLVEAGYGHLTVDEIIRLKENGVRPDFLKGLRECGWSRLPVEDAVHLHSQGVSASYACDARGSGVRLAGARDLAKLRNQGVRPSSMRAIHDAGFGPYSVDESVLITQHGVSPDLFRALQEAGVRRLSASDAVAAHDRGLNASAIRRMRQAGVAGADTIEGIVRLKAKGGF